MCYCHNYLIVLNQWGHKNGGLLCHPSQLELFNQSINKFITRHSTGARATMSLSQTEKECIVFLNILLTLIMSRNCISFGSTYIKKLSALFRYFFSIINMLHFIFRIKCIIVPHKFLQLFVILNIHIWTRFSLIAENIIDSSTNDTSSLFSRWHHCSTEYQYGVQ